MASFRTKVLFRFSKEFDSFEKVLKNGIYPNYCEEDLSFDDTPFVVGIPMACFCDIPITLLDEQTTRYGLYGIGLSKEWGIRNRVSPVMYIANDVISRSVYYHIKKDRELFERINSDEYRQKVMEDIVKGSILENLIELLNAKNKHSANTHILGYLKKYEGTYKGKKIINYLENEWRYLVPDDKETPWMWTEQEYKQWRFPNGNTSVSKPTPTKALRNYGLTFGPDDVRYILVRNAEFYDRTIELIKEAKTFGGLAISEEDKVKQITKIITMEQVKEDF